MSKSAFFILLVVIVFGISACKSSQQVSRSPGSIQGDWQLVNIQQGSGEQMQVANSDQYTLSFNTDGTVAGQADCKVFTGAYNAEMEGVLNINEFTSNKVNCSSDSYATSYLTIAQEVNSFQVTGSNQMTLVASNGDQLMFTRVSDEMQNSGS